ncbi:helix-turn-helix transcriptional regulator [Lunatibacter salilacus]|uniref:helix-turn-helix transcriptional regulator n=1 Tax=Lunatibacter salilacus TaxID=2483804 RepID=UPI0018FE3517|nr:helix-turn-helix transcriptional regulator [Lunatibacter salilacus]
MRNFSDWFSAHPRTILKNVSAHPAQSNKDSFFFQLKKEEGCFGCHSNKYHPKRGIEKRIITNLPNEKNWSQGDLAQQIGASREIIGKYERNENLPSIEMVAKMVRAFGVTVDFLIWEGENASYDKETVERINDIQKMDADTKSGLFNVIDTYIQNFKTKQAFAK